MQHQHIQLPSLLLGVLYVTYLLVIARIKPQWEPVPDPDAIDNDTSPLMLALAQDQFGPCVLIFAILGSIMPGIATPTEFAAIGALGSMNLALLMRSISWN